METSYELYIKQNGRWILEGNYRSDQREAAVDEAKQLVSQPHIQAAKVIREKHNPATGVNLETTNTTVRALRARKPAERIFRAKHFRATSTMTMTMTMTVLGVVTTVTLAVLILTMTMTITKKSRAVGNPALVKRRL